LSSCRFFFNDPSTTELSTLSLHDALPISARPPRRRVSPAKPGAAEWEAARRKRKVIVIAASALIPLALLVGFPVVRTLMSRRFRSEEHTSELQSRSDLVCRLLLEKKKITM